MTRTRCRRRSMGIPITVAACLLLLVVVVVGVGHGSAAHDVEQLHHILLPYTGHHESISDDRSTSTAVAESQPIQNGSHYNNTNSDFPSRKNNDSIPTTTTTTTTTTFSMRALAAGDFNALNSLLNKAVIRLPDATMESGMMTMQVTNLRCTNLNVDDVRLSSQQLGSTQVGVTMQVHGLDMDCYADYTFKTFWVVGGGGSVFVKSLDNSANTVTQFTSTDYANAPPYDSSIDTCQPTVNINELSFSDGGFLGVAFGALEGIFRGRFERMAQDKICEQLGEMSSTDLDAWLRKMKATLDGYPRDIAIDPLAMERFVLPNAATNTLLAFTDLDKKMFGFWMDKALQDVVKYLSEWVPLDSGGFDMNANVLLREHWLGSDGAFVLDAVLEDSTNDDVVYKTEDRLMKTEMTLQQVKVFGLDSLSKLEPLEVIGDLTLQNKMTWEFVSFELDVTINIEASALPDSYIVPGTTSRITEKANIKFGIRNLSVLASILLALDEAKLGDLRIGSLLERQNIFPCMLSSVYHLAVSAMSADAMDIQPPTISGFVSPGLDRVVSNAVDAAFLMYESSLLHSSKAFFHTVVRDAINKNLDEMRKAYAEDACIMWELPSAPGAVDLRELLLSRNNSIAEGGPGVQRYGDLFSAFVMPSLEEQVLTDDKINERFIRPYTSDQSGVEGTLVYPSNLFEYVQENSTSPWWDIIQLRAHNAKLHNADTISSPLAVLRPKGPNVLSNTVGMGDTASSRPLNLTVRLSALIDESSPLAMESEFDVSVSIPSSEFALDLMAFMDETSLLQFPLKDVADRWCWLAAVFPNTNDPVDLQRFLVRISSLSFNVACVSCPSAIGAFLPKLLSTIDSTNFTAAFRPRVEKIIEDFVFVAWDSLDVPGKIQQAPELCPYSPQYSEAAAVSVATDGWVSDSAPEVSISRDSIETITAVGVLSLHAAVIAVSQNYLLHPEQPSAITPALPFPNRENLLDWTDLTGVFGSWAGVAVEAARKFIQGPADQDGTAGRKLAVSEPRINALLREHILDADGVLTLPFHDLRFEAMGAVVSVSQIRLSGLDSISRIEPFVPTGPYNLENDVSIQKLGVKVDLDVIGGSGDKLEKMILSFDLEDVKILSSMVLAMDLEKLGALELGAMLRTENLLPCVMAGAHNISLSKLRVSVGRIERPRTDGFISPALQSVVQSTTEALFEEHGGDIVLALPTMFESTIKDMLNAYLKQLRQQEMDYPRCSVTPGDGYIDFRDLFLSPEASKQLGGVGSSPYGTVFQAAYGVAYNELFGDSGAGVDLINGALSSWTERQSNQTGVFSYPGSALDASSRVRLANLEADIAFNLWNVSLRNANSLGSPIFLLEPSSAYVLDNKASFGVGKRPVCVGANMMLSASDGVEMQIRNEISASVDLDNVAVFFSLLLKMSEKSFLAFPLKDLTNAYCWLGAFLSTEGKLKSSRLNLLDHKLTYDNMDMSINCTSCTSPDFSDLLLRLYSQQNAEATVLSTATSLLDGEALQTFLDQVVRDAATQCPHSDTYNPDSTVSLSDFMTRPASQPLDMTDFRIRDSTSAYFNIANGIFAACLLLIFIIGKLIVQRRNNNWKKSLSSEGILLLRQQAAREKEQDDMLDVYTTSLFWSPYIPQKIRIMVPIVILLNIALYLVAHLSVLSTVDVDVQLAGQSFTIHHLFVFTFFESAMNTYENGGMEMSIMLWIFACIWPYFKCVASLFLWFLPPRRLSASRRGRFLLWLDTLTKLSVIDIVILLFAVAILFIYIGGPEVLSEADGELYSMTMIVIPGAGFYCLVVAQRISRVSSRFLLDHHDKAMEAARKAYERGNVAGNESIAENANENTSDMAMTRQESSWTVSSVRESIQRSIHEFQNVGKAQIQTQNSNADSEDGCVAGDPADSELASAIAPSTTTSKTRRRISMFGRKILLADVGVAFGLFTIVVLGIIGAIYAPSVALEVSDVWELALESGTTYERAVSEYGVYSVVSSLLLKTRFVLNTTYDYIGLGLLLAIVIISIGMMFFIGVYRWTRRIYLEGWRSVLPFAAKDDDEESLNKHKLPSYLQLHAYKFIEIYVIAVIIGVFQLGSIAIYAIHLYCSLLDAVFKLLAYIGLVQSTSAQCYAVQMGHPDNLVIFFGCFFLLLINFVVQIARQYKSNERQALCALRQQQDEAAMKRLSQVWHKEPSSRRSKSWASSRLRLSLTRSMSDTEVRSSPQTTSSSQDVQTIDSGSSPQRLPNGVSNVSFEVYEQDEISVAASLSPSLSSSPPSAPEDHHVLKTVQDLSVHDASCSTLPVFNGNATTNRKPVRGKSLMVNPFPAVTPPIRMVDEDDETNSDSSVGGGQDVFVRDFNPFG